MSHLRKQFEDEHGLKAVGHYGGADIEYVKWLEAKVEKLTPTNTTNSAIAIVDKYLATKNITQQEKEVIKLFRYWLTQQH